MKPARREFSSLDRLSHLKARHTSNGSHRRCPARHDLVAQCFAACDKPSQIAQLAQACGLKKAEIFRLAKNASSFGNWSMVLRNRIRGTLRVLANARKHGVKLTPQEAAYVDRREVLRGFRPERKHKK